MANEYQDIPPTGDRQDEQISALEDDLQREKRGRRYDRVIAILVALVLIDIHVFTSMPNWGGPIAILILEVILLIFIGRVYDIELVEVLLDKILGTVRSSRR